MAVWHYKTGGTKTSKTACTAGDWTDANCFDSAATANVEWFRILKDEMADGDSLIFYDEDTVGTVTTHTVEVGITTTNLVAGDFTITSRSGDPSQCVIQCSGDTALVIHNNTGFAASYTYSGLSLKGYGTAFSHASQPALIQVSNANITAITLDNCWLTDTVFAQSGAEHLAGLILGNGDGCVFTFNDCEIKNITTSSFHGGGWIGQFKDGDTVNITGTMSIKDCTIAATTSLIRGGFWDGADYNITGDITMSNIHCTQTTLGVGIASAITTAAASTLTVTGSITGSNMSSIGGAPSAPILTSTGPFDVSNLSGSNITVTPTATGNSVGGVFLATSATATGTIKNVIAEDVDCFSGAAVYFSVGGNGTVENVIARRCSVGENGMIYAGGDGDMTVTGFLIEDCTSVDAGAGIYGHNHGPASAARRNKTVTMRNGTIVNCVGNTGTVNGVGDGNGAYFNSASENTKTLEVTLENIICRCGSTEEMLFTESGAENFTVTVNNCNVENDTAAINSSDVTNVAPTITNIISTDPLFTNPVNSDYSLSSTSPCLGIASKWWTGPNPISAGGEPFSDWDIDIGGIQSKHSPFHPFNL